MKRFSTLFLGLMAVASIAAAYNDNVLNGSNLDLLKGGVLNQGILNSAGIGGLGGLGLLKRSGASDLFGFGGILGGILRSKGVAATACYSTKVFIHANIAANIAVDIPTQSGLLTSLVGVLGGITNVGNILGKISTTTTVLHVKSNIDVEVTVGLVADTKIAFPEGYTPLFTKDSIFGYAQVGLNIEVDAEADIEATLFTPVIKMEDAKGIVGLLKMANDSLGNTGFISIPTFVDQSTGRLVSDLGAHISGTYFFVNVQVNL